MSATIWPGFQQNWYINGDPDSTLVLGQGGIIYKYDIIVDSTTGNEYIITGWSAYDSDTQTYTGCTFQQFTTNDTILPILSASGWQINTTRGYVPRSSPAFNTSYTPSATNDTQVIAVISLTSTLLLAAQVNIQVDSGSGFLTISEESLSGIAATSIRTVTITVPAGSSYKLVNTTGTVSIVSI